MTVYYCDIFYRKGLSMMSLIHCTCDCVYQSDGYCGLEKAGEITGRANGSDCLHYVKLGDAVIPGQKSAPDTNSDAEA